MLRLQRRERRANATRASIYSNPVIPYPAYPHQKRKGQQMLAFSVADKSKRCTSTSACFVGSPKIQQPALPYQLPRAFFIGSAAGVGV